ncbi:1-(5-phosphoribosyl)-5-amino-4-imidazole- carboxylate (AIR) carboxylase [Ignisphaera aggregans DSM 17230]|uniref:1-(5-phosphoribosyl)-5-amino-4-imidazole-carboxylate (AIR) carboxylase n=1 Tax=Ignisphaera aggregans (strain DSM 17230 / JCM 13409 / AQ1.S1) TaxID=583356 RepID=E0SS46_IGNAA|nr:1-(5-phosphoribosyl)-5-amino-4-imidazole- carboxylate (AIR) carboxylase [Ignisphaera aggregans DSM 17230]
MYDLRKILEDLVNERIDIDEAVKRIRLFGIENIENMIRFDISRHLRRDVPEIVFGEGKDVESLARIIKEVTQQIGRVIVSRLSPRQIEFLRRLELDNISIEINDRGRIAVARLKNYTKPFYNCRIGIVAAGTADIGVAEEARVVVEEMGCRAIAIYDVGIAGLHRVIEAVKRVKEEDVDVVIAIAGMEGALPSVLASLLDIPVIGVPTSIGYGVGGKGKSALYSMLQACPLGLAVVNIDNGVNAAIIASLIGRRIALYRSKC